MGTRVQGLRPFSDMFLGSLAGIRSGATMTQTIFRWDVSIAGGRLSLYVTALDPIVQHFIFQLPVAEKVQLKIV